MRKWAGSIADPDPVAPGRLVDDQIVDLLVERGVDDLLLLRDRRVEAAAQLALIIR
jgi:hypothetical protein